MVKFGELTEEESKRFREAVDAPAEKTYSKDEMELWPEDDGDDDLILNHAGKEQKDE